MSIKASELKAKVSALGVDSTVSSLIKIGDEFDKLGTRVGAMTGTLQQSQGAWKQFKDEVRGTNFAPPSDTAPKLKEVGDELEKLGKKAKGAAGDIDKSKGAWTKFKEDFTSGFNFSAGFMAFDALKDGLGSLGAMAMSAATEYESSMNMLAASTGASQAKLDQLGERARELGGDLDLPATSAGGAANAMLELSRAGLSVDDSMLAAKGTIQLAATEMMAEADAARITAGALNAFGLKGQEATRVADLLAAGSNASAASVRELGNGVQQAGFAFSSNNQSLDDLVTSIGALTNVGLTGADAGTALKNAVLKLAAPTAEAKNLMQQLGFNAFDAQGKMKPMEQLIDELNGSLAGMTDEQRNAALNTIFLSDGMKAMIPLLDLGGEGFDNLRTKVQHQGAAAELAEARTKGFTGAMEGFKSALETAAVEGLTPLLPILTSMIKGFSSLVGIISDNVVPIIAAIGAGLGAYALSAVAGAIATGTFSLALDAASIAAIKAAAATALAAAPFVAIAAIVGGSIVLLNHYTDTSTEMTKKILEQSESFQAATKAIDDYRLAQETTAQSLKGVGDAEAAELERLTALYEEKLKRATGDGVGNWFAAAFDSDEVTNKQLEELQGMDAEIQRLTGTVQKKTEVTEKNTSAAKKNDDAMRLSREGLVNYGNTSAATAQKLSAFYSATTEDIEKAEKAIQKIEEAAPAAMADLLNVTSTFQSEREAKAKAHEDRLKDLKKTGTAEQIAAENASYQASEQTAAVAYVESEGAYKAHLGRMLIDWINSQAMINEDFAAKSGELVQFAAEKYGVMASDSDIALGASLNSFRRYADGSIDSLGALDQELDGHMEKAQTMRQTVDGLSEEKVTALRLKFESDGDLDAYIAGLQNVQPEVRTEIKADAANAVAQAEKAQDQYNRMERKIESEIIADPVDALLAAAAARDEYGKVPAKVTTVLHADGMAVRGEATAAGLNAGAGFAAGIAAAAAQAATAARNMAGGAIAAARAALHIESPSRVFMEIGGHTTGGFTLGIESTSSGPRDAIQRVTSGMVAQARSAQPAMAETGRQSNHALITGVQSTMALVKVAGHLTGQTLNTAVGAGIESAHTIPRDKLKKSVGDVAAAYRDFTIKQEEANRAHAGKLAAIWDDYYRTLKEQTDQFNGDKFDSQMGFYERVADMDSAQRQVALQQQQVAWETSQQMAQQGRAAEAQEYYDASLKEIEANQQRADRITGIAEDIAAKKRELADASTEEQQAALAAEIAELESRKAYLEQLDAQQDELAASRLEELKNADSAVAAQRDEALSEERGAYKEAQDKLAEDFGSAVDGILGHEDRMLAAHVAFANELISSYQGAADAARRAAASLPSGGGGGGEESGQGEGAAASTDGSHALGLKYVPFDGYIAELHKGEEVKTAEEAEADRRARQFARVGQLASSTATAIGSSSSPTTTTKANGDGDINVHFDGPVYLQSDTDIKELAYQVAKEIKKQRGTS